MVLLGAAIGYTILQRAILEENGRESKLAVAVGNDWKGKASIFLYVAAIPLAFVHQVISDSIYVFVTLMWLVPDRRIEDRVVRRERR